MIMIIIIIIILKKRGKNFNSLKSRRIKLKFLLQGL